jgi:membrane-bound lytic murein transglycosylase MltF
MVQISDYGGNWSKWDDLFKLYSKDFPWQIAKTICMIESSLGGDPRVSLGIKDPLNREGSMSEDGLSWGLMQLTLPAAQDFDIIASPTKLNNPEYSIQIGCKLIRRNYRRFQSEEEWTVKAYNQGATRTAQEKAGIIQGSAAQYWKKYQERRKLV